MAQPREFRPQFTIELLRTSQGYAVDKFGVVERPPYNKSNISHNQPAKVTSEADILALVEQPFAATSEEEQSLPPPLFDQIASEPPPPANLNGNQLKDTPSANGLAAHPPELAQVSWFSLQKIHDKEIDSVPEFFTGKGYKTPELYLKYRNFVVKLFRSDPLRYLTKIACRRALKGDANAIIRIHIFLEISGIINFGLCQAGTLNFEYPLIKKTTETLFRPRQIQLHQKQSAPVDSDHPNSNSLVYSITSRIFSKAYRSFCVRCGMTCGMVWFQSKLGTSESCICEKCYLKLSEPEKHEHEKTDISRRIQSEASNRNKLNWSVDENFKMIEALTEKDATWDSMYQRMGHKRTKEDIIFHFLQFPMTNFDPSKKPPDNELALSTQAYIKIIKDFYEKSPYYSYDLSGEEGPRREFISEDLKNAILLELEKSSKKLSNLEEIQVVHVINELKTNIANIITDIRMKKQTKPEIVPAPQTPIPLSEQNALIESFQVQPQIYEQQPQDFLTINDDIDRYLR